MTISLQSKKNSVDEKVYCRNKNSKEIMITSNTMINSQKRFFSKESDRKCSEITETYSDTSKLRLKNSELDSSININSYIDQRQR